DERRLQLAHQHVLVVRQHAAGLEQPAVRRENLAHQIDGEVDERQARDDVVVDRVAGQVLQRAVDDFDLVADGAERRLGGDALGEQVNEVAVDLDSVEAVVGVHAAGDLDGDGAAAGPDLEDAGRRAEVFQVFDEGPRQEAAAGENCSGRAKVFAAN